MRKILGIVTLFTVLIVLFGMTACKKAAEEPQTMEQEAPAMGEEAAPPTEPAMPAAPEPGMGTEEQAPPAEPAPTMEEGAPAEGDPGAAAPGSETMPGMEHQQMMPQEQPAEAPAAPAPAEAPAPAAQ